MQQAGSSVGGQYYGDAARPSKSDTWLNDFHNDLLRAPTKEVIGKRKQRYLAASTARGAALKLFVAVLAIWILFTQVFGFLRIEGNAMRPTAGDGDLVLTTRFFSLESDDLVVYQLDGKSTLGRVVAQPGDTVEITSDGDLKVNGNVQASVTQGNTSQGSLAGQYPITLGEGQYFILNDSRDDTADSRQSGAIGLDGIDGKVIALLRIRGI